MHNFLKSISIQFYMSSCKECNIFQVLQKIFKDPNPTLCVCMNYIFMISHLVSPKMYYLHSVFQFLYIPTFSLQTNNAHILLS